MLATRAAFWRHLVVAGLLSAGVVSAGAGIGRAHAETMRASYYGAESGSHNADGSRFCPSCMTAAHRTWPFGTRVKVCLVRCVVVTVRDRGPALWTGRALDLAHGAARAIGLERLGVASVRVAIVGGGHVARRRRIHRRRRR